MELIPVLLVVAILWLLFFLFLFWGSLQMYKTILTFSTPAHSTGAHPKASELLVYSQGAQKQGSLRQTRKKPAAYTQVERYLWVA